jgi:hypothetical protein
MASIKKATSNMLANDPEFPHISMLSQMIAVGDNAAPGMLEVLGVVNERL